MDISHVPFALGRTVWRLRVIEWFGSVAQQMGHGGGTMIARAPDRWVPWAGATAESKAEAMWDKKLLRPRK